jgi:hypothetical protein
MRKIIVFMGMILFFGITLCSAQEEITLTTYYPSPHGVYDELRAKKMGIGENWYSSSFPIRDPADLIVEGNVGIGTTSPGGFKLYVNESLDQDCSVRIVSTSSTKDSHLELINRWGGAAPRLEAYVFGPGAPGGTFFGRNFANTSNLISSIASSFAIGTSGGEPLIFGTSNRERMRIDSSGNVGIGTTSPAFALDINQSQTTPSIIRIRNPNSAVTAGAEVQVHSNSAWIGMSVTSSTFPSPLKSTGTLWTGSGDDLWLGVDGGLRVIVIKSGTGNVGIGTTSPGAKLEVNGQVKITGGTPGAGKVLTSDASGLGSWETPTGAPAAHGLYGICRCTPGRCEGARLPAYCRSGDCHCEVGYDVVDVGGYGVWGYYSCYKN